MPQTLLSVLYPPKSYPANYIKVSDYALSHYSCTKSDEQCTYAIFATFIGGLGP